MVSHGLGGARGPLQEPCLAGSLWRLPLLWPLVPALCLCFCALSHATQAVLAHLMGREAARSQFSSRAGGASTKSCGA